jgi:hypothetical protein
MSSTPNTFESLNSIYKEAYADRVKDLIPEGVVLLNRIEFVSADKQPGNLYHQPVTLGLEHGFTYGGSGGTAFALRNAVASSHEDAQIKGHEMILRSFLSVGAVSRSKGKNSFIQASKLVVQNMLKSFARRLEVQLLYGQAEGGIGVVESISAGNIIKIEDHEWAAGIWSGSEKMSVEIRSSAGALRGEATVESNSLKNKTITVDAVPAGTAASDVIYYAGAFSKEFAGIHKIITNTSSLFNIDASSFSLWRGNSVDVGTNFSGGEATLSFNKLEESIAVAMEKGLAEEDVLVICNPKSWTNLLVEQAAKRQYDQSYSDAKLENGAKTITFYGQNGKIEIHSSIYCKEGYSYVLPMKEYKRIGSSDVTLDQPGFEGKFLKLLENANAYEMRAYTDQALFCAAPGTSTLLQFIKS